MSNIIDYLIKGVFLAWICVLFGNGKWGWAVLIVVCWLLGELKIKKSKRPVTEPIDAGVICRFIEPFSSSPGFFMTKEDSWLSPGGYTPDRYDYFRQRDDDSRRWSNEDSRHWDVLAQRE